MRSREVSPGAARRFSRPLSALALFLPLLFLGCAEDPKSPDAEDQLSDTEGITLEGAQLPEVLFEGEDATAAVWGALDGTQASFERIAFDVTAPTPDEPGIIIIRALARLEAGNEPGTERFSTAADLPTLEPGEYVVTLKGREERAPTYLFVLPRSGWVHLRGRGGIEPGQALVVHADGRALAFRQGERVVRGPLSPEQMADLSGWLSDADFFGLDPEYLSDPPSQDARRYNVLVRERNQVAMVTAEEELMPAPLSTLVDHLSGLIEELYEDHSNAPTVIGQVSLAPVNGESGTPRLLRLRLKNHSREPATLRFPTEQTHDFLILRFRRGHTLGNPGLLGDPGELDDPNSPDVLIWNWAFHRDFAQVETELVFAAGEEKVFEAQWTGHTNQGGLAGDGLYEVRGEIPATTPVRVRSARLRVGEIPEPPPLRLIARLGIDPLEAPVGTRRELTIEIASATDDSVAVTFNSTMQYDFQIRGLSINDDPAGNVHWTWSDGRGFGDVVFTDVWAPGEVKTFTEEWDGNASDGTALSRGKYFLFGFGTTEGGPIYAPGRPIEFVVLAP